MVDKRPSRNPRWAPEEIILALDVYITYGQLDDRAAEVVQLSEALSDLEIHPERPDAERWRNPNGVALKLANFAHLDPGHPGQGMSGGSKLDRRIFELLHPDPDLVKRLAADIRAGARVDLDSLAIALGPNEAGEDTRPTPSGGITSKSIPVEQSNTSGSYEVSQPVEPSFAERMEQPLVRRFCNFLEDGGYLPTRVQYTLEGVQYFTDIVVGSMGLLIEAKYHTDRTSIRMAAGQVKDYDFMESEVTASGYASLAVLLGNQPTGSALRYLAREDVEVAWATNDGWTATTRLKELLDGCKWL